MPITLGSVACVSERVRELVGDLVKVVMAFDSFKGSLSATRACALAVDALKEVDCSTLCVQRPLADGGEGTASALMAGMGGVWVPLVVTGPLPEMRVDAGYVWLEGSRTAVIEMAVASGLPLLKVEEYDPLRTTTRGTGELIAHAISCGARTVLLAVGGSATVDCGFGAATALGWRFLNCEGQEFVPSGGSLVDVVHMVRPKCASGADVQVLCDVTNPLTGPNGAVAVYAPQKGASADMLLRLEAGLCHVAGLIRAELGMIVNDLPGAGAAGGLAAGAVTFLDGRLVPGIDAVMKVVQFEEAVSDADWVITGEGCFDGQSVQGKVVSGVVRVARECDARLGVIAGCVRMAEEEWRAVGIDAVESLMQPGMSVEDSIGNAEVLLRQAVGRLYRERIR